MPDNEVERYRRVAQGVRKKLVGLALEHAKKHDDVKNELMQHAAHAEGTDDSEFSAAQRHDKANERATDLQGTPPSQDTGPTNDEEQAARSEQKQSERAAQTSSDMAKLGADAGEPKKSGAEDHGWAEHETDAEHSAEPDGERQIAEDPGEGEEKWQLSNRKIGKTAKGIIGAYKGGK